MRPVAGLLSAVLFHIRETVHRTVATAAAMALGTSATARAAARGWVHTLRWGPRFNGDGTFTVPFGTVNIGGTIVIDISGGVGTYTVAADCTGTLSVTDGPSFSLYVGPGAQQLWMNQTAGGAGSGPGLGVGTATRLP